MARPKIYDDSELLRIMAELLVHPPHSGAVSVAEAIRKAIAYVPGSDNWGSHTRGQAIDRLKKGYKSQRVELEKVARETPRMWPGPLLPTLLTSPVPPNDLRARGVAEELLLKTREAAEWVTGIATELSRQLSTRPVREINSALLAHAKALTDLIDEEYAARSGENPPS